MEKKNSKDTSKSKGSTSRPSSKITHTKRLYRSKKDRIIGGVCAGIAEYFNIDPTIIRLIFVLVAFSGGFGFLAYLVLWVVVPEQGDENSSTDNVVKKNSKEIESKVESFADGIGEVANRNSSKVWFGIIVISLGIYLTLVNFGFTRFIDIGWYLSKLWPLFVILLGVLILVNRKDEK